MTSSVVEHLAETSVPVIAPIAARRSTRAFDPETPIDEEKLTAALEAARWAASAYNGQPWRFAIARRGSDLHAGLVTTMTGFNQDWAPSAAAFVVAISETTDADGRPTLHAAYDLGQAVANFSVQAQADGLHVHQMSGFDAPSAAEILGLEPRFVPVTIVAIGELGDPEVLPDALREREYAPRERRPLSELLLAR